VLGRSPFPRQEETAEPLRGAHIYADKSTDRPSHEHLRARKWTPDYKAMKERVMGEPDVFMAA
jgi:hypothetical protein